MKTVLPDHIQRWIDQAAVPQRLLFSGNGPTLEIALELAAQMQGISAEKIRQGAEADTVLFSDNGKSFKVAYSDAAQKDDQSEYENARGLVIWAHKKPARKYRIMILEHFERANRSATNALLKLIEEPPEKTYLFFTSRNHHQLLDTIISRVTTVRIGGQVEPLISEEIEQFFRGKTVIERFKIIEILDKASKETKKIDRTPILNFLEQCSLYARKNEEFQTLLPLFFETEQAIRQNFNVRFSLERLAMRMGN